MKFSTLSLALLGLVYGQTNETSALIDQVHRVNTTNTCTACTSLLSIVKTASNDLSHPDALAVLQEVCQVSPLSSFCRSFLAKLSTIPDGNLGLATDFLSAVGKMDTQGQDGEYMCYFMVGGACPKPEFVAPDLTTLIPRKRRHVKPLPQSRGRTFNALHLTDIHLQNNYTNGAPTQCIGGSYGLSCCYPGAIQDPSKPFKGAAAIGDYNCDTPMPLLESTLMNAATNETNYDFSIFTGDLADHGHLADGAVQFPGKDVVVQEEIDSFKAIKKHLGGIATYPVIGNHDTWPYAQTPPIGSNDTERFLYNIELMEHMWHDYGWINGRAARQARTHHTAYSVMAKPKLKIISLNTNFWYRFNFYAYQNTTSPDSSGLMQFLVEELQEAERRGQYVWIIGHIPSGGLPDEALPVQSWVFSKIVQRYNDNIAALFFGHTHQDEFNVLYSGDNSARTAENAINVAWVAPSITPFINFNPSWRYYVVDEDTYSIMDSITFFADISSGKDNLDWQQEYSARQAYSKYFDWDERKPLNGEFWHHVAVGIRDDPQMAEEFSALQYRRTRFAPQCHDATCRQENFCYTSSFNSLDAAACRSNHTQLAQRELALPSIPMPRPQRLGK